MRKTYRILCIDDDPEDIVMLKEAFALLQVDYEIIEAHDGQKGLETLKDMKEKNSLPCLIVLDINMPRMDGRETFQAMQKIEGLSSVPVVVFSTSSSPMDKLFFSKKSVEYFVKPIDFKKLSEVAYTFINICDNSKSQDPSAS